MQLPLFEVVEGRVEVAEAEGVADLVAGDELALAVIVVSAGSRIIGVVELGRRFRLM